MNKTLKCIAAGGLAGAANGLFGAGGGLFLVPLFIRWIHMEPSAALPTSIAVILPICVASSFVYLQNGGLRLGMLWPFLIGGLAGGIVGGLIYEKIPTLLLRRVLGAFIIYGAVRAIFF